MNSDYVILNFSQHPDPRVMLRQYDINIVNVVSYIRFSNAESLNLFECVSNAFCRSDCNIIYFVNALSQIQNNRQWFESRNDREDIIADIFGNILFTSDLFN